MAISGKGLKICCGVTSIFFIIIVIVLTTLSLTILKPKQPEITAHPVGLKNIKISANANVTLNVTIGMVVTIDNRNYGSFKYQNSTAYVNYRGTVVAEAPIEHELVPARGKVNISTFADIMADKLITNPHFWEDVAAGSLNLTSTSTLHGKVSVFKILKLHATAYSTCDISFFIVSQDAQTHCHSKIKI